MKSIPAQVVRLSELLEPARRVLQSPKLSAAEKHDLLALILERIEWQKSGPPLLVFVETQE